MNGVALAYAGVHQIFQLALAAYEMGELDGLFCSLVDGDGKWGRRLGKWVPPGTARPLGSGAIPAQRLTEFPWPLLANRMLKKLLPSRRSDHLHSNVWFDNATSRWLGKSKAKVFVGSESCALTSLRQAGALGMKRVLDCPGIPSQLLDAEARIAAEKFELNISNSASSTAMMERKQLELGAVLLGLPVPASAVIAPGGQARRGHSTLDGCRLLARMPVRSGRFPGWQPTAGIVCWCREPAEGGSVFAAGCGTAGLGD